MKDIQEVIALKRRQLDSLTVDIRTLEAAIKIMEVANVEVPHPQNPVVQVGQSPAKTWP